MRTYIERSLKKIKEIGLEKRLVLSCDIYYDDLAESRGEQYVVKIHDSFGLDAHFRTNHIRKSVRLALDFVKRLEA